MENSINNDTSDLKETEFKMFATKHIVVGILLTVVALWVIGSVLGFFEKPAGVKVARQHETDTANKTKAESADEQTKTAEPETLKAKTEYNKGTAGHIMSTDFVAMGKDTPAGEAIRSLKKQRRDINQSFQVYVVDPHDRLVGMVTLKQLMFANDKASLKDLMSKKINSVIADTDEEKVAKLMARENIKVLPVVNKDKQIAGIVKAEDVGTLIQEKPVETARKKPAVKKPVHPDVSPELETAEAEIFRPNGVAFIEALIQPLTYELHERFWGWRPNDILNFTDNVNNFQQGVLEVTRRTAVILAERISRTGSTASFDPNLERAMNWFMIKSDRYWFPSPESKYSDGIKELKIYKEKLEKGAAKFYTRTDNLIPLLAAYEDLLGSCDENLIKDKENDGTPLSFFKADDYFFYAKGVASAMHTILGAILEDFHTTIDSRRGLELLHHAIESCHHAVAIDPLIVTNSNLSGVLANHRANMAAPISHARFYLGVLIKTLST
ncbi:MAG: DUF2333 family protein [Pseudomonadota bacterium]